jgi:hypothetical protein
MRKIFVLILLYPFVLGSEPMKHDEFKVYLGRLTSASFRFPPSSFQDHIEKPVGETDEDIIVELLESRSKTWERMTYLQKKEFTLVALLICDSQGGALTSLLILLAEDSIPISRDLKLIPEATLEDRGFTPSRIRTFKAQLSFLAGDWEKKSD